MLVVILTMTKWNNSKNHNQDQRNYHMRVKRKALEIVGERCTCCGVSEWWNLTLDHIVPVVKRIQTVQVYLEIIKGQIPKENFQTLCFGCNNSKNIGDKCRLEHPGTQNT